jgi:hypothetical protein
MNFTTPTFAALAAPALPAVVRDAALVAALLVVVVLLITPSTGAGST